MAKILKKQMKNIQSVFRKSLSSKIFLLIFFFYFFSVSLILAATLNVGYDVQMKPFIYPTNQIVKVVFPCSMSDGKACGSSVSCNTTITDQKGIIIVKDEAATYNSSFFTYDLVPQSEPGDYKVIIFCTETNESGSNTFPITISPTGTVGKSIFFFIIFVITGLGLIGLGIIMKNPYFGFIGGMLFMVTGVYVMINGFLDLTDIYTQGFSYIFIGLGAFFTIVASYEWVIEDIFGGGSTD